uniref:Uncharacterized protein n=1 Tax=Lepeophtheirus salmonis TaxID=72036 RepID=A0A0K2TXY8_LEPSM
MMEFLNICRLFLYFVNCVLLFCQENGLGVHLKLIYARKLFLKSAKVRGKFWKDFQ